MLTQLLARPSATTSTPVDQRDDVDLAHAADSVWHPDRSGASQLVAGLVDRLPHRLDVERLGGVDGHGGGAVRKAVDGDVGDAGQGSNLFSHRGDAVSAGNAGDCVGGVV